MSSLSLGKAKNNRNAALEETRLFLIHQFTSKWLKWSWDLLVLQFSILTNVFIPSLPPKQNRTEGQMKWEVWEWLIPIISFSLGSSCSILFCFVFNYLGLFIALHLPTFDVNWILKARTYMLSIYHIVSKYRAWNILFVEQIVTTKIHCVVTMAPGTGLLYSSLNRVVFILLLHPRKLKTREVK